MNFTKHINLSLLLLLLVLSCGKKDDEPNVVIDIEEEFNVQLIEDLRPGANRLMANIRTRETLDCLNYDLGHSQAVSETKVVISIDDLALEGPCVEGNTFASTDAQIGDLATGDYELQINLSLNSIANVGLLSIFSDHYEVRMETSHGIVLKASNLKKIPDNYLWGYVQLTDPNATDLRDVFYEELQPFVTTSALEDGNYAYFEIDNGLSILNPDLLDLDTTPLGSFIFQLNGNKEDLLQLVTEYQTMHEGQIKIGLFTSEGEVL